MLIYLIADLTRNHQGLKQRFATQAPEVIREYGLTPDDLQTLKSRDPDRIGAHVAKEAQDLINQELGAEKRGTVFYPYPPAKIVSVQPSSATVGTPTQFTVTGHDFQNGMKLSFTQPRTPPVEAHIQSIQKGPNSALEAVATFETPGSYTAVITERDGTVIEGPTPITVKSA